MAAELTIPSGRAVSQSGSTVFRHTDLLALLAKLLIYFKLAAILLAAALLMTFGKAYADYREFAGLIDQQIAAGYLKSHAGFYAAPRVIERGAQLRQQQLVEALQRAGYARETSGNIWNGSFQTNDKSILIFPRKESDAHEWIKVSFAQDRIVSLTADDQSNLSSYALEPELLTEDTANKLGERETLTFEEIPPVIVQAIIAIEDRRFFQHSGLDFRGITRAAVNHFTSGSNRYRQGGSTITQQLVKNIYLSPEKTLRRKYNEALIAIALEHRLSKEDIFALYCNEVYLGQRAGVGIRGVAQAAQVYFGKPLKDLSLAEAATIAGMIQSPGRYSPERNPDASKMRRDLVIAAMKDEGLIDENTERTAYSQPVTIAPFEGNSNELAPYYVDLVERAMGNAHVNLDNYAEQSIRIQTTIDPDLQTAADNALRHQLELVGKNAKRGRPEGAIVAIDPHTGNVLAMVGGRSYEESQLNRATDARRQPGSVFKPFVYAAALERGISPLTSFLDAPQTFQNGYKATYSPANYGNAYSMHEVLMREGLVRSLNVVTVELALRTGLSTVADFAADFGLPKPAPYPALALGTTEVTPLQIAAAYAPFANGGKSVVPIVVRRVSDTYTGEVVIDGRPQSRRVIKDSTAYMITDMLSDVIKRGTARRANVGFKNIAVAGKTGTSRDGWFVGYTPNLVCAVWIGFDDNKQLGLTGAEAALPAWMDFIKEAVAIRPSLGGASFPKPADVITVRVDPESGALAGPNCPSSIVVSVSSKFAPRIECWKHAMMYEALVSETEVYDVEDETEGSPNEPSKGLTPYIQR
ncbi:MAG TPA: PBP1A family penicillin-binding protein [Pyrinomonadaceae bacterium]|nr:PBP1A family penicillin-binding protein [Pyrinomonadaceae bacterium]